MVGIEDRVNSTKRGSGLTLLWGSGVMGCPHAGTSKTGACVLIPHNRLHIANQRRRASSMI